MSGIDASMELVEIAARRTPHRDFRVGDLEALPWPDGTFDWVTGFSAFQFADDKVRALSEARRVSRAFVAIAIPARASESGLASVFKSLAPLFPAQTLEGLKDSGIFALSGPGVLDQALAAAGLRVRDDDEVDCPILFTDAEEAVRAFIGAGPTSVAIEHSGVSAVARALSESLAVFTSADGRVTLPGCYRVALAEA